MQKYIVLCGVLALFFICTLIQHSPPLDATPLLLRAHTGLQGTLRQVKSCSSHTSARSPMVRSAPACNADCVSHSRSWRCCVPVRPCSGRALGTMLLAASRIRSSHILRSPLGSSRPWRRRRHARAVLAAVVWIRVLVWPLRRGLVFMFIVATRRPCLYMRTVASCRVGAFP
jgi:hypothetical protein